MSRVRMTVAAARRAGIIPAAGGAPSPIDKEAVKPRRTRRQLPRDRAVSTCHTCGEQFGTDAAEARHVRATLHPRYTTPCDTVRVPSATVSDDPVTPDPDDPDPDADTAGDDTDDDA